MQPLPDYTSLRRRLPDHKIPIRDHYGFELQTHAGIARRRMEALEGVKIPENWTSPVLHQTRSALAQSCSFHKAGTSGRIRRPASGLTWAATTRDA